MKLRIMPVIEPEPEDCTAPALATLAIAEIAIAAIVLSLPSEAQGADQAIITCDRFGCSDRLVPHKPKPRPAHSRSVAPAPDPALDLITIETAGGSIEIARRAAEPMRGFIADVVARGFKGRIKCYSLSTAHVPRSRHKIGEACDFAQRGWNKTVRVMYRVGDLAKKHGLRDGCSFNDCGHIDTGAVMTARTKPKQPPRVHEAAVTRFHHQQE